MTFVNFVNAVRRKETNRSSGQIASRTQIISQSPFMCCLHSPCDDLTAKTDLFTFHVRFIEPLGNFTQHKISNEKTIFDTLRLLPATETSSHTRNLSLPKIRKEKSINLQSSFSRGEEILHAHQTTIDTFCAISKFHPL